jgi:hypothetical protein
VCLAPMTAGPPPNATVATGVACADFGIRAKVRESERSQEIESASGASTIH